MTLPFDGAISDFYKTGAPKEIRAAIDDDTRAIFCESVANPGGYITDLPEIANSIIASAEGRGDLNVGDSTGSALTQITLVLAILLIASPATLAERATRGRSAADSPTETPPTRSSRWMSATIPIRSGAISSVAVSAS